MMTCHSCLGLPPNFGREMARSTSAAPPWRSMTTAAGPMSSNRRPANPAPNWTDTIDPRTSPRWRPDVREPRGASAVEVAMTLTLVAFGGEGKCRSPGGYVHGA